MKDYYRVLGVASDADQDVIRAAGKTLSRKYHPDNQQTGDNAKFREVREAIDVLGDPQARAAYDMVHVARRRTETPPAPRPAPHARPGASPVQTVIKQLMRANAEHVRDAFGKAALDIGVSAFEEAMNQNPVLEKIIRGAHRRRRRE